MNSEPATNTDLLAWGAWLQMNDTFYPTGAYSHSFGLEGLIDAGIVRDRATLRDFFLQSVLPSLLKTDLPLVAHARAALEANDWKQVERVAEIASAVRVPFEMRQASEAIGRQRIDLLVRLRRDARAMEFQKRVEQGSVTPSQPLAVALESLAVGAALEMCQASMLYASFSGMIAAAMKLLRLGQNGGQTLMTEILEVASQRVQEARGVSLDDVGWSNPWWDIASARHEHASSRLFIS